MAATNETAQLRFVLRYGHIPNRAEVFFLGLATVSGDRAVVEGGLLDTKFDFCSLDLYASAVQCADEGFNQGVQFWYGVCTSGDVVAIDSESSAEVQWFAVAVLPASSMSR